MRHVLGLEWVLADHASYGGLAGPVAPGRAGDVVGASGCVSDGRRRHECNGQRQKCR